MKSLSICLMSMAVFGDKLSSRLKDINHFYDLQDAALENNDPNALNNLMNTLCESFEYCDGDIEYDTDNSCLNKNEFKDKIVNNWVGKFSQINYGIKQINDYQDCTLLDIDVSYDGLLTNGCKVNGKELNKFEYSESKNCISKLESSQGHMSEPYECPDTEPKTTYGGIGRLIKQEEEPVANDDFGITLSGKEIEIDVLANDIYNVDHDIIIKEFNQGRNGNVNLSKDNKLIYTPAKDQCGEDSFKYTIENINNGLTNSAQVTVKTVGGDKCNSNRLGTYSNLKKLVNNDIFKKVEDEIELVYIKGDLLLLNDELVELISKDNYNVDINIKLINAWIKVLSLDESRFEYRCELFIEGAQSDNLFVEYEVDRPSFEEMGYTRPRHGWFF